MLSVRVQAPPLANLESLCLLTDFEFLQFDLGDFVGIGVSATRQFAKWPGMAATYKHIRYKPVMTFLKFDGEVLGGPFPAEDSPETPVPIHRAKLQRALYDYVVSLCISVTFSNHVSQYFDARDTEKAGVITDVGERFEADLIVAADGVGSKSWKLIQVSQSEARSSGFAVYRTAFPTEVAHGEPAVAEKFPVLQDGNDDVRMYLGPDTHAITLISKDITTWSLTHKVSLLLRAHSSSQASREKLFPPMLILDKGHRNIRRIMVQANVR
jgi:2-polyprenyl-6-methoxyphenol hydroxylase-like FAD-dependent oxidoreductase